VNTLLPYAVNCNDLNKVQRRLISCRLLLVAHREKILKQSLACFQGVMKDANFGDLFVGSYRPSSLGHLFLSMQTFMPG